MIKLKYFLFVMLIATMLLPDFQKAFHWLKVKPLNGDFVLPEEPVISLAGWMDGSFQKEYDNYLEHHIGFRPFLFRINNQIAYTFFDEVTNKGIVKGKDDYLFEPWYINTYFGKDFLETEKIEEEIHKLTSIDSVLKSRNIHLIVALAPGKADVFPEKIPGHMVEDTNQYTNYKVYSKKLRQSGIAVFDMNSWFMNMKPTFERNLFTKSGTHWSRDAAMIVLDSLFRLIEHETDEERNCLRLGEIKQTDIPLDPDVDLLKVSNLLYNNPYAEYYYPDYEFEKTHANKGKLIAIGDSFFWILFNTGLKSSFEDVKYWYYYNSVFPDNFDHPTTVKDIDVQEELFESDVVLLMSSTSNLAKLGWGFLNEAYDLLVLNTNRNTEVERIIARIINDPKWYDSVKEDAKSQNIEVDSMLRINAEYLYNKKHK